MASIKSWFERLWSEERRQGKRQKSLPLAAYYWDGGVPAPRQVRDISLEGMYLLTEQRWYPNTLVNMTLTRSDKSEGDPDRSVRVTARVVRAGTDGVGMAFILPRTRRPQGTEDSFLRETDRKTLHQFLARLQADTGRTLIKFVSTAFARHDYSLMCCKGLTREFFWAGI
jgi:hypothetical protein